MPWCSCRRSSPECCQWRVSQYNNKSFKVFELDKDSSVNDSPIGLSNGSISKKLNSSKINNISNNNSSKDNPINHVSEPKNFNDADKADTAVDYSKLEYIGEFEGTAYTPSPDECSNSLGYTASGKPIVAGVSIAVDTAYWKLGTEFYIEGLGYVVAMDTGSAVKGKYRFDYAVFDRSFALKLGRRKWNVYKVLNEQ